MFTYFIRMLAVILFQICITICVFGSSFAHKFTFWHGNTRTQFRATFWKALGNPDHMICDVVDYVEACLQMVPSSKSQLSWKKSRFQTVSDPHTNMPHGASPQSGSFYYGNCRWWKLIARLNFFNAQLSPKRYWWGSRSQEVGVDYT